MNERGTRNLWEKEGHFSCFVRPLGLRAPEFPRGLATCAELSVPLEEVTRRTLDTCEVAQGTMPAEGAIGGSSAGVALQTFWAQVKVAVRGDTGRHLHENVDPAVEAADNGNVDEVYRLLKLW